jgi:hypothetical protein
MPLDTVKKRFKKDCSPKKRSFARLKPCFSPALAKSGSILEHGREKPQGKG